MIYWIPLFCVGVIAYPWFSPTGKKSLDRIENIQKRALRFVLNDYGSSYHDLLIQTEVPGIKIMTLRLLAIEVFKCVNKLNPEYLNEMLSMIKCPYNFRDTSILERSKSNTTRYGLKSFRNYGAKYGICYQTTVNQLYHWMTLRIWSNRGMVRVVSAQFVVCF